MMKPFLKDLAQIYCRRGIASLHDITFVFPSKRAGNFFTRYLTNEINKQTSAGENACTALLLPQVYTITDFIEHISGCVTDNRIDMIMLLYQEYCRLQPDGVQPPEFDSFYSWADMVLADFNEVDMYMAEPRELFKNLSDYKNIQTDYLTDEQKEVVENYFRIRLTVDHTRRFWMHFNPEKSKTGSKQKFLKLWMGMFPLYKAFSRRLESEGLCYPGKAYRIALQRLNKCSDIPAMVGCSKVVLAGFNVLSTAEFGIFSILKKVRMPDGTPFADFYWDAAGPAFKDPNNAANHFIARNIKFFPSPADIRMESAEVSSFAATISVTGCPSNISQTKEIYRILDEIASTVEGAAAIKDAKVAIVLPDEQLLTPLIYSIPASIPECNITRGYPLRHTPSASFVTLLRIMQTRRRKVRGIAHFFGEDVAAVLQHPLSKIVLPEDAVVTFNRLVAQNRMYIIPLETLRKCFGKHSSMFEDATMFPNASKKTGVEDSVLRYLYTSLDEVLQKMYISESREYDSPLNRVLEAANIETYLQALCRLDNTLNHRRIHTGMHQTFRMMDRLLASETVTLKGEPLRGLQIMGMLETRCLDFDYVIIPSMNEKIFPRVSHQKSFIPNALRYGYGLATKRFEQSIYAYNFYRLISRAKAVHLLYDTRVGGLRSGDVSRYILQLKHIYHPVGLSMRTKTFNMVLSSGHSTTLSVPKDEDVRGKLDRYFEPLTDSADGQASTGQPKLSASALKNYLSCPLLFYFKNICGMHPEDRVEEFISAIDQGQLFHLSMQTIYSRMPIGCKINNHGYRLIDADEIEHWLKHRRSDIGKIVDNIISNYFKTQYDSANTSISGLGHDITIYRGVLMSYIEHTLRADIKLARNCGYIVYMGSEVEENVRWKMPDGREVNMKYIIDRLDALSDGNTTHLLRISDYKTGSDKVKVEKFKDIFTKNKAVFQLMLYANLYAVKHGKQDSPIRLDLYCTRDLHLNGYNTLINCNNTDITDYRLLNEDFLTEINRILQELFDYDKPFEATDKKEHCTFCDFAEICRQTNKS